MTGDGARNTRSFAIVLIVHLAVLVLWQVLVDAFHVPKFILPSPLATIQTLGTASYAWGANTLVTAIEILGGFALGAFVGVTLAVIFSWAPLISLVLLPLFVTLNMIPKVALGPLLIVWFSYGIVPNILIAFSICFFPILLTTARGLREVEPDLLDLVKSLRGSRWTLFRKIQLPGSLPYIFSGMKVGRHPRGRRRHSRRVHRLRARARLPHDPGAVVARHARDGDGRRAAHPARRRALRLRARPRTHLRRRRRKTNLKIKDHNHAPHPPQPAEDHP
ncbi:ABC-type nitrate/sulfonate/bicarbonate transport system permease component [Bradyrhizobium sp. GM6.1]